VLDAAAQLLAEHGTERVTIPEVAKRSGVHETTIYRRWGNADSLALDAVLDMAQQAVPIPDTGALRSDLVALLESTMSRLQSPIGSALARLSVQAGTTPQMADQRHTYWTTQLQRASVIIGRAVARGELPESTPVQLSLELLVAPLYMRLLVTGEPLEPNLPQQLVDLALALGSQIRA
jgi:AcrR family transcriptional regulator